MEIVFSGEKIHKQSALSRRNLERNFVINAQDFHDSQLRKRLEALSEADEDYWSFKGNSTREYGHGLFQYPAMMVPQIARVILEQACSIHPEIEHVGDPFLGSGTIMTESMMRGFSFYGVDINPLAILVSRVKSGPFFCNSLKHKSEELAKRINLDCSFRIDVDFPNLDKWFTKIVQASLCKIRRAILQENSIWTRRFFWIVLAETVRYSSNSRTSTYKLHIRTPENIKVRSHDPIVVFEKALERNLKHYEEQAKLLSASGHLVRGRYKKDITISLGDVRQNNGQKQCDIIITSPPYGDNATTVPYGQYSYLPLQWINMDDIESNNNTNFLASTHEIDTRSLGGSKRVEKSDKERLLDRSESFAHFIKSLDAQPRDRALKVFAFFRDLDACIEPILKTLRPGGLMVWTLGNRKVGGKRVPLDLILDELLSAHNTKLLCKLTRRISSKKMAPKNNVADTMSREIILVMRKAV
ncbi:site-specific DNA-methyltransferase [bacterium]|nr:site-specific DNA-methyltransferase [bacterium]